MQEYNLGGAASAMGVCTRTVYNYYLFLGNRNRKPVLLMAPLQDFCSVSVNIIRVYRNIVLGNCK
jgi:hypothetical protein